MLTYTSRSQTFSTGLAMFSMFFGAGNIIFPLAIGHYAQDKTFFAILGLLLTAVAMPFSGLIAMMLFDGNYNRFFGRIGKFPGFLVSLLIITLLGPLGSTPRCIALSYSTLKMTFPALSPIIFSAIACVVIFLFSFRKNRMIGLLGNFLTPLLLISLAIIIFIGIFTTGQSGQTVEGANLSIFLHGLKEGYNTMDLLAAFFFSSVILASLKIKKEPECSQRLFYSALKSSCIGAFLLSVTYIGFSYVASLHANGLEINGNDELLGAITLKIIGPSAGLLVCATIALACLTTAIALISVFADFVCKDVFDEKISYEASLIGSLVVTFFMSTLEFNGISAFLGPILQICYPGLIILTLANIAYSLWNFKHVKIPVFFAFILSVIGYYMLP